MVSMRNSLVSAIRTMHVLVGMALRFASASVGMGLIHLDHMLIDVVAMHVMKMAVVQIIRVTVMFHRNVSTPRPMPV